ncbi:uncharacterized protein RJT20DRAFT_129830 [Scheffersomyces xylosifermentans]|uniref:uncharacterized protein n=1 Tax=Scheffersomyces xylosifermentans TaxID=1304137 RepID=UPI00315CF236
MSKLTLLRPFSVSSSSLKKVNFFNNSNILSLSLKNIPKTLHNQPKSPVTFTSHQLNNYLRSNTEILKSSLIPFGKPSLAAFSRTSISRAFQRTYSRNNTWRQYNRYYNNTNWDKLKRPAIFTALFCIGTTVVTPYLFDYTPLAYLKRNPTAFVYALIAINGGVFLMWKSPQFSRFVHRYGLLVKDRIGSNWAMLGSAFSHQSFMHLFVNMFVLQSFGTTLAVAIGVSNFAVMYLNAAVVSSFISIALPTLMRTSLGVASLGASGAVFALIGTFSYLFPNAPIGFFFIPIPGGAWTLFLGLTGWNLAGTILRWGTYDYAAHLGGSVVGLVYGWWFNKKRKEAMQRRRSAFRF